MFVLHPLADIGRYLDHTGHLLVLVEHRHVAGLQPYLAPRLVDTLEGTADGLALPQFTPQLLVFGAFGVGRVAEQAVVLAAQFVGTVAHGLAELGIGINNGSVGANSIIAMQRLIAASLAWASARALRVR